MKTSHTKHLLLFTLLLGLNACFGTKKVQPTLSESGRTVQVCEEFVDSTATYISFNAAQKDTLEGGIISGTIIDDDTGEPAMFANVYVELDGLPAGTQSNFDGEFVIKNIPEGKYDLTISSIDYGKKVIKNVLVKKEKTTILPSIEMHVQAVLLKPIIYIYPEKTKKVTVELNYDGRLTHTYPKYENGWSVEAHPDGTLFDENGKEYYALYWEGIPNRDYTITEGTVVEGNETIDFLETALAELGLNRKETNEFIIYWLPKMENNAYNLIHFSTKEYEQIAELTITPPPETLIRIMMVFQPLNEPIDISPQNIQRLSKKRIGFTVVEWGGTELSQHFSLGMK